MERLPKKISSDQKLADKFIEDLALKVLDGDEKAKELLAKLFSNTMTTIKRNAQRIESVADYIEADPENQRRLTEVMQARNMLINNMITLKKLYIDLMKAKKEENKAEFNIEFKFIMPKEDKIEDFIDVIPEEYLGE